MNKRFSTLLLAAFLAATTTLSQNTLDLSGSWVLADTAGVALNKPVHLPGTLDAAAVGAPSTLPLAMGREQLRHLTRRHAFVGQATYIRTIDIPRRMAGKPLKLTLERVLWKSQIAIDGKPLGQVQESLVAPHVFLLPDGLSKGQHELTLIIDNRQQYDISYEGMAHAYTDETQIRWNGVLGQMTLQTTPGNRQPHYQIDGQKVAAHKDEQGHWQPVVPEGLSTWDEFHPNLHTLTTRIGDEVTTRRFGVRSISGEGGQLRINGRPVFLRGTLECCIFPLTGTPPTDDAGWRKVFSTAREWGLNHLRFHSYCPPDAAFRVADSLGFYLQVELPVWSLKVGRDSATCRFLRQEFDRIIDAYGHHPSLCLISCGNELQPDFDFLNGLVAYMKQRDPSRLYTTTTFTFEKGHGGHPEPLDQFFVTQWTDDGWVRGQGVFDSEPPAFDKNYSSSLKGGRLSVPFISHEIGQYAVYPNIDEIGKYTGVLDPLNLRVIRADLQQKGLLEEAADWFRASGRLAYLLYKEEVERALKTAGQSGFQLLGLQDFPGQSTALVGLVDAFWDNKGACSPEEFRMACAPVTPLANFAKAVYTGGETFRARLMVTNYGAESLRGRSLRWSLAGESGQLTIGTDDFGLIELGDISVALPSAAQASRLTLKLQVEGTTWHNEWHLWVYPQSEEILPGNVLLTQDPQEAQRALAEGRRVLLSPKASHLRGLEGKFVPVFWSPVHFPKQAGTMGILCDPAHPALAAFPTEAHTDWQWWQLVKNSKVMVLDDLVRAAAQATDAGQLPQPSIVSCIDNFANNRRLSLALEARVADGRLLMTSMDLLSKTSHPEARQLLRSLLAYMNSSAFDPPNTSDIR